MERLLIGDLQGNIQGVQSVYRVFRAQDDWPLTVCSDSPQPLAEKNVASRPELLAGITPQAGRSRVRDPMR
jgi:hypothetical protein